jgi:hypothetical protein
MSVTPAEVYLSFTYLRIFLEALGVVFHVGAIQLVFPWGLVMYEILFLGLFHASPHSVLFFLIFQYLESRLFISQPMYICTILHGRIDLSTSTNVLFLLIGILCFSNIT